MLVRHGSSGTDDMSLADRSRPLDPRGERELAWLAAHCSERLARPDLIVTSPASRALTTAHALAEAFGCPAQQIHSDERLYGGWGRGLPGVLSGLADELGRVLVVAHNPEASQACRHLAPAIGHLPSGALAALAFDVSHWRDVAASRLAAASLHAPVLSVPCSPRGPNGTPASLAAVGGQVAPGSILR